MFSKMYNRFMKLLNLFKRFIKFVYFCFVTNILQVTDNFIKLDLITLPNFKSKTKEML